MCTCQRFFSQKAYNNLDAIISNSYAKKISSVYKLQLHILIHFSNAFIRITHSIHSFIIISSLFPARCPEQYNDYFCINIHKKQVFLKFTLPELYHKPLPFPLQTPQKDTYWTQYSKSIPFQKFKTPLCLNKQLLQ